MRHPRSLFNRMKDRLGRYVTSQVSANADRIWHRAGGSFDISYYAELDAALVTARYYQRKALTATAFPDSLALLSYAADAVAAELANGLFLEFGVYSGRTINHLATCLEPRMLFGFDTFTGLPEAWRTDFPPGTFSVEELPQVATNVQLIKGLFADTLPDFLRSTRDVPIALMHVDCDLYSSTRDLLHCCRNHLKPGTLVAFDEYWNYPGWAQHEFKAWREFCRRHSVAYEYLAFVPTHQQVLVRITSID